METLTLTINGEKVESLIEPNMTLQEFLHDTLGMTGTKKGCGSGLCGCCTVLVDGMAVKSCLILAMQVKGRNIRTIEGLAQGEKLDPVQEAFIENAAIQCGFCSPGMIMASKALLEESPNPSEEDVRMALSGNLCRCTGYHKIVKAVLSASEKYRQAQA
ncbi:MAG: (2Fe-2S)-binding protein [Deltaproteobacteria bacterium]|nr:MAG: (2Fe-2S)-binding protein [Deltaproteobacteria bacterium]